MTISQAAYSYVGAFVDELARAGLRHVVVCPGSRSTPLALMLAGEPRIKLWLQLDERSAAFFALGMAKAQRFPVGLLCTSGTAAANFLPAIVEARAARAPLVVLTADRPPELRDTGASQTIDQIKLYGGFVKWYVEMALPEASAEALRYARTIAGRAVAAALAHPSGAVHLNFPFREPLVPAPGLVLAEQGEESAIEGRPAGQPYIHSAIPVAALDKQEILRLAAELSGISRGLIVAGPDNDEKLPEALVGLATALGYPILADPLSGVRAGPHDRSQVLDAYDAFLRDGAVVRRLKPEVVFVFGAIPTSKPVLQFLKEHAGSRQILVGYEWTDPNRLAAEMIPVDPAGFCAALSHAVATLKNEPGRAIERGEWLALWGDIQLRTRSTVTAATLTVEEPFEGRVFLELAETLPDGAAVWVSSSMPVRDLDTFFPGCQRRIRFLANRGANGIDGVVSSALGAAAVLEGPLVLVIGDIAFYHDMNGLLAAKLHHLNATIILLNNDGGGIFSFLPQAEHPEHFEALFGTPHGLDFKPAATLYGAQYRCPSGWEEFRRDIEASFREPGLKIVEVRTDRQRNVALHRAIWPKVSAALREFLGGSSFVDAGG